MERQCFNSAFASAMVALCISCSDPTPPLAVAPVSPVRPKRSLPPSRVNEDEGKSIYAKPPPILPIFTPDTSTQRVQVPVRSDRQAGHLTADSLRVEIKVKDLAPPQPPGPVAVVLLIDGSGAVEGSALQSLKLAAREVVASLNENDTFGLVDFGADPHTWPGHTMNAEGKAAANDAIEAMQAQAGLNYPAALAAAGALLSGVHGRHRVFLVTGSSGNFGLTDQVIALHKQQLSVTAIGYGTQFDTQFLARIAELGGGTFGSVPGASGVGAAVIRDIDQLRRVHATGIELLLQPAPRTSVDNCFGRARYNNSIYLPDLAPGEEVTVFAQLTVNAVAAGDTHKTSIEWDFIPAGTLDRDADELMLAMARYRVPDQENGRASEGRLIAKPQKKTTQGDPTGIAARAAMADAAVIKLILCADLRNGRTNGLANLLDTANRRLQASPAALKESHATLLTFEQLVKSPTPRSIGGTCRIEDARSVSAFGNRVIFEP